MCTQANETLVIFIYHAIKFGGIGTYIYEQIKALLETGVNVAWLKDKKAIVEPAHKEILTPEKITILNDKIDYKIINNMIDERGITQVKIISFAPLQFLIGEEAKNKIKNARVHNFYFVPHFTEGSYYLEEFFIGKKAERVRAQMSKTFKKMSENGNIRYFANTHIEKMNSSYGLGVEASSKVMVPRVRRDARFDEQRVRAIYNQEKFNILTVSRLDFPHKGFVLGLVKEFFKLKEKYPNITLTIVGDGPQRSVVQQEIDAHKEYSDSVVMVGSVAPEKLNDFYDKANINISVAGCYSRGALRGVLSCPARHYCMDCEVYGFSSERIFSVDDKPGQPVSIYIEKALAMTEEEYVKHSRDSFNNYQEQLKTQGVRDDFLTIEDKGALPSLTNKEIRYIYRQKRAYFSKYICEAKKEGLLTPIVKRIKARF